MNNELLGAIIFTVAVGIALLSFAPSYSDMNDLPDYDCTHYGNCNYYGSNQ